MKFLPVVAEKTLIRDTVWRQRYITTSKEYLINCHILF